MADNDPNRTTHNRNTPAGNQRGTSNAVIIGGVIVAVLVIAYFLFGMGDNTETPTATDTTGTVEAPEGTTGGTATGTGTVGGGTAGDPALGTDGAAGDPAIGTGGADDPALGTDGTTGMAPATDAETTGN